MEVKVNSQKTNPQLNQSQPQKNPNINDLQKIVEDVLTKYLTQQQNLTPQQNNLSQNNGEFIVRSNMKASIVALKVEKLLTLKKKVVVSALGFAIPILIDSVLLVRKDMKKLVGKDVNVEIELFEKQMGSKIISGVRAILSLS